MIKPLLFLMLLLIPLGCWGDGTAKGAMIDSFEVVTIGIQPESPLRMKIDTVKVDTIRLCHKPVLKYTIDTTYYLTPEQVKMLLNPVTDAICKELRALPWENLIKARDMIEKIQKDLKER